jgi:hypothetical protein
LPALKPLAVPGVILIACLEPSDENATTFAIVPASVLSPTSCWKIAVGVSLDPNARMLIASRHLLPVPNRLWRTISSRPSPLTSRVSTLTMLRIDAEVVAVILGALRNVGRARRG